MSYGTPPLARQLEHGRFNRFLASRTVATTADQFVLP